MPRWTFPIELSGEGETIEEAWNDAVNSFATDPGEPPEEATQEDEKEEE